MNPAPLSPYTVNLLLQYISPPSQLDRPIPSNLISKSLLRRHHFLSINPDNPDEYLCWPSPHSKDAIRILESIGSTTPDLGGDADRGSYSIRYSSDDEQTFAHVTSEDTAIRLVFEWDYDSGEWKYHDATVMPFPSFSHDSLDYAVSSRPTPSGDSGSDTTTSTGGNDNETDDESYWDAYGQCDDYHPEQGLFGAEKDTTDDSEDAYWAQYSSVQGTADSTIPSPAIPNKRKTDSSFPGYGNEPSVYSHAGIHLTARHSPSGRLSPTSLTNRLNSLVTKDGRVSPSSLSGSTDSESVTQTPPIPIVVIYDSDSPESPTLGQKSPPQQIVKGADICRYNACHQKLNLDHLDEANEDGPLRESIRGIYGLWKAGGRGITPQLRDVAREKEQFLRIVKEALA